MVHVVLASARATTRSQFPTYRFKYAYSTL